MDAKDPERGGGITEQAHIKLFRTHTSEGPELQKGSAPLAANPEHAESTTGSIHSVTVSR